VIRAIAGWLVWAALYAWFVWHKRRPSHTIMLDGRPYISRWFLSADPPPGSTLAEGWHLHRIHASDGDRRLHNHPTEWARAWILRGGYVEQRGAACLTYAPGDRVELPPHVYHRIRSVRPNTWTLFRAGPKHGRGWGFR
jgi:hypothetical protein